MGFKSKPGDGVMNKGMKGNGVTLKNNSVAEVVSRLLKSWRAKPGTKQ